MVLPELQKLAPIFWPHDVEIGGRFPALRQCKKENATIRTLILTHVGSSPSAHSIVPYSSESFPDRDFFFASRKLQLFCLMKTTFIHSPGSMFRTDLRTFQVWKPTFCFLKLNQQSVVLTSTSMCSTGDCNSRTRRPNSVDVHSIETSLFTTRNTFGSKAKGVFLDGSVFFHHSFPCTVVILKPPFSMIMI